MQLQQLDFRPTVTSRNRQRQRTNRRTSSGAGAAANAAAAAPGRVGPAGQYMPPVSFLCLITLFTLLEIFVWCFCGRFCWTDDRRAIGLYKHLLKQFP